MPESTSADDAAEFIVDNLFRDVLDMVRSERYDDLRILLWEFLNFDGLNDEEIIAHAIGLGFEVTE